MNNSCSAATWPADAQPLTALQKGHVQSLQAAIANPNQGFSSAGLYPKALDPSPTSNPNSLSLMPEPSKVCPDFTCFVGTLLTVLAVRWLQLISPHFLQRCFLIPGMCPFPSCESQLQMQTGDLCCETCQWCWVLPVCTEKGDDLYFSQPHPCLPSKSGFKYPKRTQLLLLDREIKATHTTRMLLTTPFSKEMPHLSTWTTNTPLGACEGT